MRDGRLLRIVIAVVIAIASVRPFVAKMYASKARNNTSAYSDFFDQGSPEYPKFLRAVAAATPPGSSIAIFVPMRRWDEGYSYAYYRASYFLAGREVLPVVWRDDRLLGAHLERADYIAAWKISVGAKGFKTLLKSSGGTLYRRDR